MDTKVLLVKCITLLYRENQLGSDVESSNELIKTVVGDIKSQEISLGINTEREAISALKSVVLEMCNESKDHIFDAPGLLQQFKLCCGQDDKLYDSLEQGLKQELSESSLKRSVVNLRKSVNTHFKEDKITEILSKAAYAFKFQREKIKDTNQFLMEMQEQLEPLQVTTSAKDPAVISDVDIGDEVGTGAVFNEIKNNSSNEGILQVGWKGINRMMQGGFRRGEMWRIDALQHKYKTGFSLSLFKQVALYNKPYMIDVTKKPLLLRISFEDDLTLNLQFLYQALKEGEGLDGSVNGVDPDEMSAYVKQRMQVNGYHIKMMRVDPTQWTYKHVCNKIIELEAQGYEIHLLMLDYLAMIPTTGCVISGPMGSDLRDMFRRMRNFCASRKITCVTPHQLSTEAKQLLRDGRQDLVKTIVGLGYTDRCRTLDNEVCGEIIIHIEKYQGESWLTCQRGKHRLPTIIPETHMYCVYKFPKKGAIPDDLLSEEDSSFRKVGSTHTNEEKEDLFSF